MILSVGPAIDDLPVDRSTWEDPMHPVHLHLHVRPVFWITPGVGRSFQRGNKFRGLRFIHKTAQVSFEPKIHNVLLEPGVRDAPDAALNMKIEPD